MSAKNELIEFVENLTPDQIETLAKYISYFQELISSPAESLPPCHPEPSEQTA